MDMDTRTNKPDWQESAVEFENIPNNPGVPKVSVAEAATMVNQDASVKIDVRHTNFWYGAKQALYDVSIRNPRKTGHCAHRTIGLRQINIPAYIEPHERSHSEHPH